MGVMSEGMELELFKEYLSSNKKISKTTINNYVRNLRVFLDEVKNIEDYNEINRFLVKHSIKLRNYSVYFAIQHFLKYKFLKDKTKVKEILQNLLKPEMKTDYKIKRKYLYKQDLLKIISNFEELRHQVIALIQTETGLRVHEVLKLKMNNFISEIYTDKNGEEINILRISLSGKGQKGISVCLFDKNSQEIIHNYLLSDKFDIYQDYLFLKKKNYKSITGLNGLISSNYEGYRFALKKALKESGIDEKSFSTHDFRRCFSRTYWDKTKDITKLKDLLHHSRIDSTLRYLNQSGLKDSDLFYENYLINSK